MRYACNLLHGCGGQMCISCQGKRVFDFGANVAIAHTAGTFVYANQCTWNSHFGHLEDNGLFSPNFQTPPETPFLFLVLLVHMQSALKVFKNEISLS